jgi:phytoene dehydrogenase-like protein
VTRATVVGSGPNGLAAAAVLAVAGIEVTVVEAAATIGGGTRTSELTIPGLLHDECSGFHPLAVDNPFTRAVDLTEHGLRWSWPEVQHSHPLDGTGRGAAARRSIEETAAALGEDGPAWSKLFAELDRRLDVIEDDLMGPVLGIPRHPIHLARFGLLGALPAQVLARRFSTPEARALWAGAAAHAIRPLSAPFSSTIGLTLAVAAHRHGWPVAVGGSRAITDAMASVVRAHGGVIETGTTIRSLGELEPGGIVLLDTSPGAAAAIVGDRLPRHVARAYRRYRHGPGASKLDVAVDGGIPWLHEPSQRAGTVHVGGSFEEIAAAEAEVHRGRMPVRPFVLVGQAYLADPGRSVGDVHAVSAYAHVPAGYAGDASDAIVAQIERFAPGFTDRIVARHVTTARDLSEDNANNVGGDILNGANSFGQLVGRPRWTASPYATGVEGIYLCSAATPPGAGAHGMCGFNAATLALAHLGAATPPSGR